MKSKNVAVFFGLSLLCVNAWSYEFATGRIFLHAVVGPTINVLRYDAVVNQTTPGAGLVIGLDAEYVLDAPWSITAGFRPAFTSGYVDLGFGVGGRYRWTDLGVPLSVFAGLELTPAFLVPLSSASSHFNLGLRGSTGVDYFIMNNLVLGLQIALEPSYLMTDPFQSFETSIEVLFGLTYKI